MRKTTRAFFYNYDSFWKRDAVHTRLSSLGSELLNNLSLTVRSNEKTANRALIFVGYSYGGLVIKQALVQATANYRLKDIVDKTSGITFLGTPHRGSKLTFWGSLAAKLLRPLGSDETLITEATYDSLNLMDLHNAFVKALDRRVRDFNFYETRESNFFNWWFFDWSEFCVPEQSATYPGDLVENISLRVDHSGLNKYAMRNEAYHSIALGLNDVMNRAALQNRHQSDNLERLKKKYSRADIELSEILPSANAAISDRPIQNEPRCRQGARSQLMSVIHRWHSSFETQFAELIYKPLEQAQINKPLVFVIDALDAIDEEKDIGQTVRVITDPQWKRDGLVKFFITSRPEIRASYTLDEDADVQDYEVRPQSRWNIFLSVGCPIG
ncbi:hypothetical protein BJX66DRAFT_339601 [Aspergillus keveii]|uniref:DUF676 domain-containing protein n=1 Tax=Aspergillus keveii TaxID=714993 RepID=A0ABR4G0Y0_9EURO